MYEPHPFEPDRSIIHLDGVKNLIKTYRDGLLLDTIPFWIKHSIDNEYGGYMFSLDRDGSLLDTDKAMWLHGRFVWMLSTLYTKVEKRQEWLDLARHGIEFIRRYGFDTDGKMFFQLTREGQPLRRRRYIFTEAFGTAAFAAYALASGEDRARQEAEDLFHFILKLIRTPGLIPPKSYRQTRAFAVPMILIVTGQILRQVASQPEAITREIDACIEEIERYFVKEEYRAVMETVGPNGEVLDHFDGRMLCPGHAIEAAWFILEESQIRGGDSRLQQLGLKILDWMWEWGWDSEYGGMIYYRDIKNLPIQEYWHDMKFWWQHNETIIATLMAYQLTGDEKYARWHQMVHDWTYAHFPDPEYGEWFGYLHRDGRLSVRLKGCLWKGPFHVPRMQWKAWQILESIQNRNTSTQG